MARAALSEAGEGLTPIIGFLHPEGCKAAHGARRQYSLDSGEGRPTALGTPALGRTSKSPKPAGQSNSLQGSYMVSDAIPQSEKNIARIEQALAFEAATEAAKKLR